MKLKNGLTAKQSAFKNEVIRQLQETGTINGTQAALKTLNIKDPNTAGVTAHNLLRNNKIKQSIEKIASAKGLTDEKIMDGLAEVASAKVKNITAEAKIKASVELLKLMGKYPDQRAGATQTINQTVINIGYSEAQKKLKSLHGTGEELLEDTGAELPTP